MNGAHWHLLINHVPVLGTIFGLVLLAFGWWRKSEEIKKAALGTFGIIALGAVAAFLTGEPAEETVKGVPGVLLAAIGPHEDAAEFALWGSIIVGVVALGGLIWFRGGKPVKNWISALVLVGAILVTGMMARTALLGGKIRHPEFESSQAPVMGR
jgi:hypothetical protein